MRFGVALVTLPIHIFLAVRFLGLSPHYFWNEFKSVIISVLFMVISVRATQWLLVSSQIPPIVKLGMEILAGGIVYILILFLIDKIFIKQVFRLFIKSIFIGSKKNE